jgi:hypothetical protein
MDGQNPDDSDRRRYAIRLASATTQRFLLIAGVDLQTY